MDSCDQSSPPLTSTQKELMNPFSDVGKDEIILVASDGQETGPFLCAFTPDKVTVFQESLDVEEGGKVIRLLPNGKREPYTVLEVTFRRGFHNIPASYHLNIRKDASLIEAPGQRTTNISISHSQGFQVGDHNIQQIVASLHTLISQIDAADAPPEEKREAKNRFRDFLAHPLVSAIVGGASGGLTGLLK
jgi:hypothetical protein